MFQKKDRKKTESKIYNVCVAYPFGNELPQCLVYQPSVLVPAICINTEAISTLSQRNALHIIHMANLVSENYFTNTAGSGLVTTLHAATCKGQYVLFFLCPEEYTQEIEIENLGDDDKNIESVNDGQKNFDYQWPLDKEDDEEHVLFQRSDTNNDDMGLCF